jgi:hypothetical protein
MGLWAPDEEIRTRQVTAEVNRLVAAGETFMDASCMVASWFIVKDLLQENGKCSDSDLEEEIQEILRAAFDHLDD